MVSGLKKENIDWPKLLILNFAMKGSTPAGLNHLCIFTCPSKHEIVNPG